MTAPVLNFGSRGFETTNNAGSYSNSTNNDTRVCPFVADYIDITNITCTDFESDRCDLTEVPSTAPSESLVPSISPTATCYASLSDITSIEYSLTSVEEERTYRLCADTVFDVDSQGPLYIRPNSKFICGDDAASEGNCMISGGDFQVLNGLVDPDSTNVEFRGVSFVGARVNNVALLKPGTVLFFDCSFKVSLSWSCLVLFKICGIGLLYDLTIDGKYCLFECALFVCRGEG